MRANYGITFRARATRSSTAAVSGTTHTPNSLARSLASTRWHDECRRICRASLSLSLLILSTPRTYSGESFCRRNAKIDVPHRRNVPLVRCDCGVGIQNSNMGEYKLHSAILCIFFSRSNFYQRKINVLKCNGAQYISFNIK